MDTDSLVSNTSLASLLESMDMATGVCCGVAGDGSCPREGGVREFGQRDLLEGRDQ